MRVVLFSSGEFPKSERSHILEWIDLFVNKLKTEGVEVELFHPTLPLKKDDVVHIFGFTRPENWYWIKRMCLGVILSPLPGNNLDRSPFLHPYSTKLAHYFRKMFLIRTSPLDQVVFWESIDGLFVFKDYHPLLRNLPSVPKRKGILSPSAEMAAKEMSSIYAGFRKD